MKVLIAPALLFLAGLVALAGCPSPVAADCAVVRQRAVVVSQPYFAPTYAPTVVVKKVVEAVVATPVAVYLPLPIYAGSYYPPAYPVAPGAAPATSPGASPASAPGADMRAVLTALERINSRLDVLEGRGPPPGRIEPNPRPGEINPKPAARPPAPGKVPEAFTNKCAQCHQRGKEKDGGDFVLMEPDGSVAKLEARQVLAVARKSYSGTMPPKTSKVPPLTDEEVAEVMSFVDAWR